jgi:hypothetical protein
VLANRGALPRLRGRGEQRESARDVSIAGCADGVSCSICGAKAPAANVIIDLEKGTVLQQLRPFSGAKVALTGVVYSPNGQFLYASDYGNNATVDAYQVAANGTVTYTGSVAMPNPLGSNAIPLGLAITPMGRRSMRL